MKRILSIIVSVLVLFAALPLGAVSAADAIHIYATPDKEAVCPGDEVTLTIFIGNNPGLCGWNVQTKFDEAAFDLISMQAGTVFPASGMTYNSVDNADNGTSSRGVASATFVGFNQPDVMGDGALYTATLRVAEDAAPGTYDIRLGTIGNYMDNFTNQAFDIFSITFQDTTITVVEGTDIYAGDANEDGKTNIRDLGLMQQWLNGWDVMLNRSVADVNADGKINVRDLGLMQQWMNTWDVTLKTTPPPEEPMIGAPAGNSPLDPTATAIYATVNKQRVMVDEEVTVTFSIRNNPGLSGWNVAAAFDETAFELLSLYEGIVCTEYGMTFGPVDGAYSQSRGIASVTYADFISEDVTGDGTLYTAVLKVKSDAAAGTYDIRVGTRNNDYDNFCNSAFETVPVVFDGATIQVTNVYPGDVNGDSKVNVRDLGLIKQYIQRYNVTMNTQAADVNCDGKINIRDLGLLQQYLNGWDVELG